MKYSGEEEISLVLVGSYLPSLPLLSGKQLLHSREDFRVIRAVDQYVPMNRAATK